MSARPGRDFAQTVLTAGARAPAARDARRAIRRRARGAGSTASICWPIAATPTSPPWSPTTAPDGTTDQLTKGVVAGPGPRRVPGPHRGAARAPTAPTRRMGHHALILSDRAEVDAKPELEIFADDVACAHGNTVGALDEEALFYAVSAASPKPRPAPC